MSFFGHGIGIAGLALGVTSFIKTLQASDIKPNYLAKKFKDLTGRQINQMVVEAAYRAASR